MIISRNLLLIFAIFFFTAAVSAPIYGSFPVDQEQQTDELSNRITVGAVNTGDRTLQLEFSSPDSSEYNISGLGQKELRPVSIVETPQGKGWKYLGSGRYAEIREFSFDVDISRYRDSNRIDIPLQVTATALESPEEGATSPISQSTSHNFTILLDPRLRPLERETETEKEVQWEDSGDSVPEDWTDQEDQSGDQTDSEDYKPNETETDTGEGEENGVNTLTMILVSAIVICTGYMLRVI